MKPLTTGKAAEVLGCSSSFVHKACVAGNIPYHTLGVIKRIEVDDLYAYANAHKMVRVCEAMLEKYPELRNYPQGE